MGGMPSARFPYGRIIGDGGSNYLSHGSPYALLSTHFSIVPAVNGLSPLNLRVLGFLLFGAPLRGHLPLFQLLHWPLFLQVRITKQSEISKRRRRKKIGRNLGLGDFYWSYPLVPIGQKTSQA